MLRIGISQRVERHPDRNEVRDALDQSWTPFLWSIGLLAIPLNSKMSDNAAYLEALTLDGFILSGGNDVGEAPDRDALEASILAEATLKQLPVLGVCRGMQFINVSCGGKLETVSGHAGTSHAIVGPLSDSYDLRSVNSFHRYGVTENSLGADLNAVAFSSDNMIEAFAHNAKPWLGIMWHPERNAIYSPADMSIIANHFGVKA